MKKTILSLKKQKQKQEKITMVTSYDYSSAKLLDSLGVDIILVGDSLGMVILGYEDTLSVSMNDMIYHSLAVSRGVKEALIITDMPFMSYQKGVKQALKNAARLIKEGRANAVKLEGGLEILPQVQALVNAGIPAMLHLGLTPQYVNILGGYKVQGKDETKAKELLEQAKQAQKAGAFALLLECVPYELAKTITKQVSIPVIGIGAGKYCDGQVLVWQDILGINTDFKPKFVKNFLEVSEGLKAYIKEVKEGTFPNELHSFSAK